MRVVLPVLVFALLVAPATRMLALGLQARQPPELLGGLFFAGLALGLPLRVLGHSLAASQPEQAVLCNTLGHVCFAIGAAAMAAFTCQVFRRDRAWARFFCVGLADPVVADRFRLWAVWTAALSVLPSLTLLLRLLARIPWIAEIAEIATGQELAQSSAVLVLIRRVFVVSLPLAGLALSLSFFPPERYVRWVRARSAERSAGSAVNV